MYRKSNPSAGAVLLGCAGLLGILVAFAVIGSFVLMLCWNAVVPTVFHGPAIDLGTAFAGMVLLNIIGGSFRSAVSARKD